MTNWISVPDGALVSLRRGSRTGGQEQWAVVRRAGVLIPYRARPEDGTWREAGTFETLEDALSATPELRQLHRGVINVFDLGVNSLPTFILDEENQPRYRREHALKLAERATVATTFTAEHPPYLYLRNG